MENTPTQTFVCKNCQKSFAVGYGKNNLWCSRSCCASFNAKQNPMTEKRLQQLKIARSHITIKTRNCVCKLCQKSFEKQASLMNHVRWVHKEGKLEDHISVKRNPDSDKKERTCHFCGRVWNCYIWHFHNHENFCKQNPNRKIPKNHPQSEESKRKLSNAALKNPYRRVRRKTVEYKGVKYDSTWEVEFAKRCENLKIDFIRNPKPLTYELDEVEHHYFPDFWLPKLQKYIEVKNPFLFENDPKVQVLKNRSDIIWLTSLEKYKVFNYIKNIKIGISCSY